MNPKVAIVTPTIGNETLRKCMESVQSQTYENLTHYIFLDGENYYHKIYPILFDVVGDRDIKTIQLQENIGKGWYGHRVYAACSFLVNADIICYLDEDNFYNSNHVSSIVNAIEGFDWTYSLRNICDKNGNFICEDNCESLGKWSTFFDSNVFHIDTACFAVRKEVAVRIGHCWYGQWGADRQFFYNIKQHFSNYSCTLEHTVNYRLDGNDNSVKEEFFIKGNQIQEKKYSSLFPWKKEQKITV
jgi:glycosyltransferase involved in cell wall biosynthesis